MDSSRAPSKGKDACAEVGKDLEFIKGSENMNYTISRAQIVLQSKVRIYLQYLEFHLKCFHMYSQQRGMTGTLSPRRNLNHFISSFEKKTFLLRNECAYI